MFQGTLDLAACCSSGSAGATHSPFEGRSILSSAQITLGCVKCSLVYSPPRDYAPPVVHKWVQQFQNLTVVHTGAETGAGGRIRDTHATGTGSIMGASTAGYCTGNLLMDDHPLPGEDSSSAYPPGLAPPLQVTSLHTMIPFFHLNSTRPTCCCPVVLSFRAAMQEMWPKIGMHLRP